MNYIQQAYNGLHEGWRYIIGTIIIIIFVIVGQLPFTVAAIFEAKEQGLDLFALDESSMMSVLEPNLNLALMLLSFAFGLVGIFVVVKFLHKLSITQLTTARKTIDWKRFWSMFFVWGILSSSLVLLDYFLSPEDYVLNFDLKKFLILSVIAIALVPLQTSCEEYLFRGYLMQGIGIATTNNKFAFIVLYSILSVTLYYVLSSSFNMDFLGSFALIFILIITFFALIGLEYFEKLFKSNSYKKLQFFFQRSWTPLIITSFIFGMLHIANPEVDKLGNIIMIYYIGTGLFLGIMTLMDDGLELALGFHAANNLFTALLVTADWTAFQTHSILKDTSDPSGAEFLDIFLPVFVIFPIILFILSKVYGWKNWKDRLFGKIEEPPIDNYKIIE